MTAVRIRSTWVLLIVATLYMGTVAANASTVTILGSGLDSSGNCLAGGSVDPHYKITSGPGTGNGPIDAVVVDQGGLPCGTIAQSNSLSPGAGVMTYTTTFDLTGYDTSTAILNGQWGGDDSPVGVFLNGVGITWTSASNQCCYFYGNFSSTSGFHSGVNTLSFVIDQQDNWYDYARIGGGTVSNLTPSTQPSPVPEPSSLVLFGSAVACCGRVIQRKSRTR